MGKKKPVLAETNAPKPLAEKRIPQKPVTLKITLNEEQKEARRIIMDNDVIVLIGKPGSGKTLLATYCSLGAMFNREISKILITRPMVTKEEMGFLPGDIKDKLDPWVQPVYHNLYQCYDKAKINVMMQNKEIDLTPLAYMRGITFLESFVIVDECQNITIEQMKMIITRIGKGSKIIFCGDESQIDLKRRTDSGLSYLLKAGQEIEGFAFVELKENHRHKIVDDFLNRFHDLDLEIEQSRKR